MEEWLLSQSEVLSSGLKTDEHPPPKKNPKKSIHLFLKSHMPFKLAAVHFGN